MEFKLNLLNKFLNYNGRPSPREGMLTIIATFIISPQRKSIVSDDVGEIGPNRIFRISYHIEPNGYNVDWNGMLACLGRPLTVGENWQNHSVCISPPRLNLILMLDWNRPNWLEVSKAFEESQAIGTRVLQSNNSKNFFEN